MGAYITNIQRYAIHDGGGIRTTVFFKGCPLRCEWCHNPETQEFAIVVDDEQRESVCEAVPPVIARSVATKQSTKELARIVLRDQIFFGDKGGVTISGGEPLAQDMDYMVEFLSLLKKHDVNIACDTCGDVPWENFQAVLPYVDLFLFDLKLASPELHMKYTRQDNKRIISNLEILSAQTSQKTAKIWLRIPVIGGVNDNEEMLKIIALAQSASPNSKVSLLPYHNMGTDKWTKIRRPSPNFYTPSQEKMNAILEAWKTAGFEAEIGG